MTSSNVRLVGTLHDRDGTGVVRLEERYATGIEDLWDALTDPQRLERWLGKFEGDLREGGEFTAYYFASGWEGRCRVEECDRPNRMVIHSVSEDQPDGSRSEITLTADGDGTILVMEDDGLPLAHVAAYGAGNQIHLEDLASYLAGGERCDSRARFDELYPSYQELPVEQ
jgi:uncharacterized protein YndB with AHSA1/START domain